MSKPLRVAVVGGGCAAMTAAFELTKPGRDGPRCEVTVYQMGHRLGGKGASGRGVSGRIEEHGLHLWMGYYENAFRLMRECYAELGRDPETCPIAKWSDAFKPANFNAVADWSPSGRWLPWLVEFPATPGLPGDIPVQRWNVPDYLSRLASLARTLLQTIEIERRDEQPRRAELFPDLPDDGITGETLVAATGRLIKYGTAVGLGALIEAVALLENALARMPLLPQSPLSTLVDAVGSALRHRLDAWVTRDDEVRRLWEVLDLVLAVIRGSIRFRLAFDPRGFDAIDDYDSREWLRLNGASEGAVNSAFIRGLYDLAFAYEGGDKDRPMIAAGAALRGSMRAFFTYRGAFFWKMTAGMGDIVFAPLYEVLRRRGVQFEFFHKLTNLRLGNDGESRHVTALEFDVQARLKASSEYRPLVDVGGLPCWPSEPDFGQLESGDTIRSEGWDLESQADARKAYTRTVKVGEFDVVVLGVAVGVIPHVCREILAENEKWRNMVEHVKSVPTQAFQLWLREDMATLGWSERPVNLSGFVEPFDTWADMTHVASREAWTERPLAIAYFCNVLPEDQKTEPRATGWREDARFLTRRRLEVRNNAVQFLNQDLHHLWTKAHVAPGRFAWASLLSTDAATSNESAFDTQFWTANVRPSDRYTQTLPGTSRFRISPLDRTYDNLTLAGDWTSSGLNTGCVEAATMSGLLAAHAITQFPRLSDIVGYDHP